MLVYLFNQSYYDCVRNPDLRKEVEDKLKDALIQTDFDETDVELRFKDLMMYRQAPHIFGVLAQEMGYIFRFNNTNEVEIRGDTIYQKCRYVFMNSMPENNSEL